jgi:sugar phosphate isomerase/epimerase
MDRRTFLAASAAVSASVPLSSKPSRQPLGLTIASYGHRWRQRGKPQERWKDALDVLEHCQSLGAGCLQIGVRGWSEDFAGKVRKKRESIGVVLEGQIGLPKRKEDLVRFESDLARGKEAGATIFRAVCLGGRRYEAFHSLAQWEAFQKQSLHSLQLAEPILRKTGCKLAIENHKDWRSDEHLELMQKLDSEWIGVNFDFGNNWSLLEHPQEAVERLAPYLLTTHFKDMQMAEYEEGFLLSEVPIGSGNLDLVSMIQTCRKHNPNVWFNLEMITRDPLKVPILKDHYWVTLSKRPVTELAKTLRHTKEVPATRLPRVQDRNQQGIIDYEEESVRKSFTFSRRSLGFG